MEFVAFAFLVLVLLGLPIAALAIALRLWSRLTGVERRLEKLSDEMAALRPAGDARLPISASPVAAPPVAEPPSARFSSPPPSSQRRAQDPAPEPVPPPSPPEPAAARSRPFVQRLEEQLGSHLPVWIGAIALALAGAFLVKLSFDRGWLGPSVRIALGIAFGIGLLGSGEALRRRSAQVAAGLSASGIAVLFVSFYASVNLYHLIPAPVGLLLLALTTAAAVGLSLRHGLLMAVIGLIGGFLTPQLVSLGAPDPRVLFLYLLLLQAGLLWVARKRGWWQLTATAFLAGLAWVALWLTGTAAAGSVPWLGAFVLGSVVLPVGATFLAPRGEGGEAYRRRSSLLSGLTATGGLAAVAALALRVDHEPLTWLFLALLGIGTLVLARLRPQLHGLAWLAVATPALLALDWLASLEHDPGSDFLWLVPLLGALFALSAYACLWGSSQPGRWAALSGASAVGYLLLTHRGAAELEVGGPWGAICLGVAGLYVAAALPVARRRALPGFEGTLAALATAATSFVSLAVPIELAREWLTVAWAIEVTALIWLAGRLRVPALQKLAYVVAGGVAVRLLLNPAVFRYEIGLDPVFNWLTYGYGLSAVAFAAAAWIAGRRDEQRTAELFRGGTVLVGLAGLTLLIRQSFHPGAIGHPRFPLTEWGTITGVWLLAAGGLLRGHRTWPFASLRWIGHGLAGVAMVQCLFAQCLIANPLWHHSAVGAWPVVNWLLLVYGAPALLLLLLAREPAALKPLRLASRLVALLATFLLVTLEIRQAFQGTYLDRGSATGPEQWAYSAAWILLGIALLAIGIVGRGRMARLASLAVMFLAVGKVFVYDMAALQDFYRIFSFLGLGASLMLLAWLYQRFVFRKEATDEAD